MPRTQIVTVKDRAILRDLAERYRGVCESDRNARAKVLWRDHNGLKKTKPPVYVDLFFGSHINEEIDAGLPDPETSRDLHWVERWFQRRLWASEIPDDSVYAPWFTVYARLKRPDGDPWGVERRVIRDSNGPGYRYLPVVRRLEDLKIVKATAHEVLDPDPPESRTLRDIFGDIIPIHVNRSTFYPIWGGTDLSEEAGVLFGLEELMYLLYDQPDLVHKLMAFMRDAVLANLEKGESDGDWSTAEHQNYGMPPYTPELPDPAPNSHGAKLKNLWFFTHSQEFDPVGPEQHEEFLLNYQMPIMRKFGLVNYGCCETLDRKIGLLRKIPNLRRICIGPTASLRRAAEQIGRDYVVSWRPNPAMVSIGFDQDNVRRIIRQGLDDGRGCNMEVMLKELMTVQGDLSRLSGWARIAGEEVDRFLSREP